MAKPKKADVVAALLDRHGRTYSAEIGEDAAKGTPAALFQLLCASLLFSARISADIAVSAAKALRKAGWTTARKMADSAWEDRARTLNESGYARYDERTATMLGETAQLVVDEYGGDLRKLREAADRDPDEERQRLKRFKGIGDVGADIFVREAQAAWDELHPFADKRALQAADRLDLGRDATALAELVDRKDFTRLVAALVRCELAGDHDEIRRRAAGEDVEGGDGGGGDAGGQTKADLYARAQELDVPGRSSMSKAELADAVAKAS